MLGSQVGVYVLYRQRNSIYRLTIYSAWARHGGMNGGETPLTYPIHISMDLLVAYSYDYMLIAQQNI